LLGSLALREQNQPVPPGEVVKRFEDAVHDIGRRALELLDAVMDIFHGRALGLVPSEHSSGSTIRRGGITKAGNALARRVLIEGAWTYRMTARVSRKLHDRLEPLSVVIRDIAWKAQVRLCARYRRLAAAGKPKVVVTTAIAREMVGFIWAIARIAQPALD